MNIYQNGKKVFFLLKKLNKKVRKKPYWYIIETTPWFWIKYFGYIFNKKYFQKNDFLQEIHHPTKKLSENLKILKVLNIINLFFSKKSMQIIEKYTLIFLAIGNKIISLFEKIKKNSSFK